MAAKKETTKSTAKKSTPAKSSTAKSGEAAKKSTKKNSSPILETAKDVAGEILIGAATGAAVSALNVAAEAVGGLAESVEKGGKKGSSSKSAASRICCR